MTLAGNVAGDLAGSLAGDLSGPPTSFLAAALQLGATNIYDIWDATSGVGLVGGAADTWTGRFAATVLSAPAAGQRPGYGPDGTNFRGAPVIKCSLAGDLKLQNLSVASIAANSRVFIGAVCRASAVTGGFTRRYCGLADAANFEQLGFEGADDGAGNEYWRGFGRQSDGSFPQAPSAAVDNLDTASHVIGVRNDAAAGLAVDRDGAVLSANAGATLTTHAAITRIYVGQTSALSADIYYRGLVICKSMPNATQLAAFYADAARLL